MRRILAVLVAGLVLGSMAAGLVEGYANNIPPDANEYERHITSKDNRDATIPIFYHNGRIYYAQDMNISSIKGFEQFGNIYAPNITTGAYNKKISMFHSHIYIYNDFIYLASKSKN